MSCCSLRSLLLLALVLTCVLSTTHASEYSAFSLKAAREIIRSVPAGIDYRTEHPRVFELGGITRPMGLVYDETGEDLILVGEADTSRPVLTLDDLVVAQRSRLIRREWPLASIDPTPDTGATGMQAVRFEGGIGNTQFGKYMFEADYTLKKIALGRLPSGVEGIKTYWSASLDHAERAGVSQWWKSSRFWLHLVVPSVSVSRGVAAIQGLKVAAFTEVLAAQADERRFDPASVYQDNVGKNFAETVSARFDELSSVHPPFQRLMGLSELVALAKAIEEMDEEPDMTWYLREYMVKEVATPPEVEEIGRIETSKARDGVSMVHSTLSGGVRLTAVVLGLDAGEVSALKTAVLGARPASNTLIWNFPASDWVVPAGPDVLKMHYHLADLLTQASFMYRQKQYDDAITVLDGVLEINPDCAEAYGRRGDAYQSQREYDLAIADYTKVLALDPESHEAYINLGNAYQRKAMFKEALDAYAQALRLDPMDAAAYNNRGAAYYEQGQFDRALADFNTALMIYPTYVDALTHRGLTYSAIGEHARALSDHNQALVIDPLHANTYNNRGGVYLAVGEHDKAISDFSKAIGVDPKMVDAYNNRGCVYDLLGLSDLALADFNEALAIDPMHYKTYCNRAGIYTDRGEYDEALGDFARALEINPQYASAYSGRGRLRTIRHEYEEAVKDYSMAIKLDPGLGIAYNGRAVCHYFTGAYDAARQDAEKALSLGHDVHPGFIEALQEAR